MVNESGSTIITIKHYKAYVSLINGTRKEDEVKKSS
ncbi:MAG: hypothetical protein JWQ09_5466 [Segetibacter sp.]|nr:hypothetical protein [Segetibacter sp.]